MLHIQFLFFFHFSLYSRYNFNKNVFWKFYQIINNVTFFFCTSTQLYQFNYFVCKIYKRFSVRSFVISWLQPSIIFPCNPPQLIVVPSFVSNQLEENENKESTRRIPQREFSHQLTELFPFVAADARRNETRWCWWGRWGWGGWGWILQAQVILHYGERGLQPRRFAEKPTKQKYQQCHVLWHQLQQHQRGQIEVRIDLYYARLIKINFKFILMLGNFNNRAIFLQLYHVY